MPQLTVRRSGNSLGLHIPHQVARDLGLTEGDQVVIQLEKVTRLTLLAGRLKGRMTADEFTRLSNEGEEIA